MSKSELIVERASTSHKLETVTLDVCEHGRILEIGQDFDEDGKLLRLVRCQECDLLMRQYLPML